MWACFVHNVGNESLKKPEFDCANIGDFYDCGCAKEDGEEEEGKKVGGSAGGKMGEEGSGHELKLEREGKTYGG